MDITNFYRSDLLYIFIGLIFFFMVLYYKGTEDNKAANLLSYYIFTLIAFTIFLLYIGLRPDSAGNDTEAYVVAFRRLSSLSTAWSDGVSAFGNKEPLFWPVLYLFKELMLSENFFILFTSFVSCVLTFVFYKLYIRRFQLNGVYVPIFLVLLLFSYELVYFGNLIRVSWAFPLCAISLVISIEKPKTSLAIAALAVSFHFSSLIILPYIFLRKVYFFHNLNRLSLVLLFGTVLIVSELVLPYLGVFSKAYMGGAISDKVELYQNHAFNLTSIFTTLNFWIVSFHVLLILIMGNKERYFPVIYIYSVILFLSPLAKFSERYFPLVLLFLPVVLFDCLRKKFSDSLALILTVIFYLLLGCFMINTLSAQYTLSI